MKATKIVAVAEAFRQAWQTESGRRVVHCLGKFTGADWNLSAVVREITQAKEIRWGGGPIGHNLEVLATDGLVWRFNIIAPAAATP